MNKGTDWTMGEGVGKGIIIWRTMYVGFTDSLSHFELFLKFVHKTSSLLYHRYICVWCYIPVGCYKLMVCNLNT